MPKSNPTLEVRLEELLLDWQFRLRLLDWDITVEVVSHHELGGYGDCSMAPCHKTARIRVVPEEQLISDNRCKDIEVTLVHELMHVRFMEVFEGAQPNNDRWESYLEQTAQALVAAKRGISRM